MCHNNGTKKAMSSWARAVSAGIRLCEKFEISTATVDSRDIRVSSQVVGDQRNHLMPHAESNSKEGTTVIVLGIILALIGFFTSISILTTIGIILIVVGAVLTILGATGRAIGGRKTWY